jgi:hypothetical protein
MPGLQAAAAFCILGIEQKSTTARKFDLIAPIQGFAMDRTLTWGYLQDICTGQADRLRVDQ